MTSKDIEEHIAAHSLESLLEMVALVCDKKQFDTDPDTAKTWRKQTRSIMYTASLAKNRGL